MKKLILTSAAAVSCLLAAPASHAQGLVNFQSQYSPNFCVASNQVTHTTALISPASYTFGLYMSDTLAGVQNSTTPVTTIVGNGFPNSGGISTQDKLAVPFAPGTVLFFEVKGWLTSAGATYEQAAANSAPTTFTGTTTIGQLTVGGGTILAPHLWAVVNSPLMLNPVPEPSTMVLGGLGVAALAFFRRRK